MDIQALWEKALRGTEIRRQRIKPLPTFENTRLEYVMLSEGESGSKDTVVRKGHVEVEKPALVLPPSNPQFEGFEFEKQADFQTDYIMNFLMVRGIRFPSLKYQHLTYDLALHEGSLSEAVDFYSGQLQQSEDLYTGLILGPEDCWQFSVLIFVGAQVMKASDGDIQRLLEEYKRQKGD